MTAAAADGPGPLPYRRFATISAHHPLATGIPIVATNVVSRLVTDHVAALLGLALGFLTLALAVLWSIAVHAHFGRMCEQCAADVPSDPQAAIERRRWVLRATHRIFDSSRALLLFSAAWIGSWFATTYLIAPIVGDITWAAGMLVLPVLAALHNPLQPWCPQCRWGDGGDEEVAPDPAPVPSGTNDRTTT